MRNRLLPIVFVLIIVALIGVGVIYSRNHSAETPAPSAAPSAGAPSPTGVASTGILASPSPGASLGPAVTQASNAHPDLAVDSNGLSKATVVLNTTEGVIKFKFYPQDAPETVNRIIELVNAGFYNGLTWHRVVPGFVVQGGDPLGNGTGGSGKKLKAEFNNRRHIEGTVAMARGGDKDSADSQFYFSLGTFPHLDHSYTVFGQVIEGMDVVRKLKVGDKIVSMIIQ
jgi:cyclophilin family peptidyl-prolyl cis-trans isomerase